MALLLLGLTVLSASPALARKAPRAAPPAPAPAPLPRLVDLGAGKCIPCKRMAPILEALKVDYAGAVDVQFVDVWQNPDAGRPYKIRLIPTQVFFDRNGRERFRHEGFFAREEIERIFKDSLGVAPRPAAAK
jgi:thioredoxin 1